MPYIKHLHLAAFALLVILLNHNAYAEDELFKAIYKGKHSGFGITMTRTLVHLGDEHYRLESHAKSLLGSISETSNFVTRDTDFIPTRYRYFRKIFGKKSDQLLEFDWASMRAHFRRSDKPKKNADYDITKAVLDPSLYQLKLQQDLSNDKAVLEYNYAKDNRLKTITFAKTGTSTYIVKKTIYDAIILERNDNHDTKNTQITVIPELGYQIAKIVHTDKKGATYKINLVEFSSDTNALKAFYSSEL